MRGAIPTSRRDLADLVRGAAVGTALVDRDPAADDVLLELVERALHRGAALRVDGVGRLLVEQRVLREHVLLDRLGRVLALELVLDLRGRVELRRRARPGSARRGPRRRVGGSISIFALPSARRSSRWAAQSLRISSWAMSSASSISASVISFAPASTIRIASSVPATIRSSSDSGMSASSGLTTNLPSSLPIRTAPTCVGNGMSDRASAAEAPFIARMS